MLFTEAAEEWDLETLYSDLSSAKGKHLTPTEKLHLRGLLCGYSPTEIAEKLHKQVSGVETDLSATIYRYVKELAGVSNEKLESYRKVGELLENAGYRAVQQPEIRGVVLGASSVNISDIKIERSRHTVVFMIKLEIPTEKKEDQFVGEDFVSDTFSE